MTKQRRVGAAIAASAALTLAVAGCSSDTGGSAGDDGEPVELEFMAWVPGIEKPIEVWNEQNPDIQINFTRMPNGEETSVKISSAVAAGNAPCLAQLANTLTAGYVANGYLEDLSEYTADIESQFLPWTWAAYSFGDASYGIPQDTGPMVMYYRTDVYESLGLTPPATWDEYAEQAAVIHEADPEMYGAFIGTNDPSSFASFAAQNGAEWTSVDGESWRVAVDSPETAEVAEYWQGLLDDGVATAGPRYDPSFFKLLTDSTLVNYVGAAWNAGLISSNVADQAGNWAVAQMPTWGDGVTTNNGGSAVGVLDGCDHIEEAVEFATWLNTSEESWNFMANPDEGGSLYPAAIDALEYPVFDEPNEFFGGQVLGDAFAEAASSVEGYWAWGPSANETLTAFRDGLADVSQGRSTLPQVVEEAQADTVDAMEERGLSVVTD
ncbi:ABC transporter substrate-binding protein [Microbacterium sp. R86528]|uniref:ABC transporter substrate-binding protein n=1 Tax=Microbacterium sp. R86528 TaxID=3093864 RepID=UPI0037CB4D49